MTQHETRHEGRAASGVVYGIALVFHTRAVAILGVARGALFPALVPGVAALLAYPALGEAPSPAQLAGLAIVSLGLLATGR